MRQPLVTIVTPSLNQAAFLRAAIESVLRQDYPRIEYLVIDGGSTDGSAAIAADYSGRLTWISEKDHGQSDAINKGFRMAKGEVLAWLNSDDLLLDGAVSSAVREFEQHPHVGAVYGEGYLIDDAGRITRRFPHTQTFNLWRLLHRSDYILQQSVFFHAGLVRELGFLREDLHYTMDWDLLLRMARKVPLHYIPRYLACLREHAGAKTATGGYNRLSEIRRMLAAHTGESIPSAWVPYAAETYARAGRDLLAKLFPGPLRPLAEVPQMLVTAVCDLWVRRAAAENQGFYAEGWAGPDLIWLLPPGEGNLEIDAELPANGWLKGQSLSVLCDGRDLGAHPVGFGPIRLELPFGSRPVNRLALLEIRASHSFVPAPSEPTPELRQYSYRLHGIGWSSWRSAPP